MMKKHQKVRLFILILLLLIFTGCTSRFPNWDKRKDIKLNTVIWNTEELGEFFPETEDELYKVPWLEKRKSFGIAFSGGGTRSAGATLGQLRALNQLGWLKEAKYISAISGGSWTAIPFTFYKGEKDEIFLGEYIQPTKLNKNDLTVVPKNSMVETISKTRLKWEFISKIFRGHRRESYSDSIGERFLKPFGLYENRPFFTFHKSSVDLILDNNKSSGIVEQDFNTAKDERPYLIVGGTLFSRDEKGSENLYQIEMTGLYTGVRSKFCASVKKEGCQTIGGGYVQSFAYDSILPEKKENRMVSVTVENARRLFSLSDVAGISGSAPQYFLTRMNMKTVGFPSHKHWPIDLSEETHQFVHGDGGLLDNLGLMPLIARKTKNILVFSNSNEPIETSKMEDIRSYFDSIKWSVAHPGYQGNIVFKSNRFDELRDGLISADEAGKPAVYCSTYEVNPNDRYGT